MTPSRKPILPGIVLLLTACGASAFLTKNGRPAHPVPRGSIKSPWGITQLASSSPVASSSDQRFASRDSPQHSESLPGAPERRDRPQQQRRGPQQRRSGPGAPQSRSGPGAPQRRSGLGGPQNRFDAGGGGDTVLRLENPMKLRRSVDQTHVADIGELTKPVEERQGRRNNDGGGRSNQRSSAAPGGPGGSPGGQGSRRPVARTGTDDSEFDADYKPGYGIGRQDSAVSDAPAKDTGRRRDFGNSARKAGPSRGEDRPSRGRKQDDSRGREPSLLISTRNTGSKGGRRGNLRKRDRTSEKEARLEAAVERRTVQLPDGPLTVAQLAEIINEKPVGVIKMLMTDLGVMASMTQTLDPATCIAVAEGFGKYVGSAEDMDEEEMDEMVESSALATGIATDDDDDDDLEPRAPVVTIMGHVDHGKTSLLDAIRDTDVTSGEAGGITQHIAAYQVMHKDKAITFIDTPGHAAFTDMRERGANITDIVILVVAADDGVKQQSVDSIACARQAGVPLVVAINKCDLETANPTKVMTELTAYDILTEELGGDVLCSLISAKAGINLDDLLDKIMLQAEIQNLKANPNRDADAVVVEAFVEKGLGTVATALVKRGTLRVGDIFVAGETYGRVRALISTADGKTRLDEAGPSTPVRVVGFEGVPSAGDALVVTKDEQTARDLAASRQRIARERSSLSYQAGLMSSVTMAFGATKQRREMCVVVKADVQGSAEALTRALQELKLENDEAVVTIKVLVSEAGEVSKSDIAIASVTPDTTVIAFNCAASFGAMEDARAAGVPIEYYSIIYDAIESVESRMQEVLSPTPDGEYVGSATVQEVFNIGGTGNIAGSRCTDGYLRKGANVRVLRGDKILIESTIKTLRNFKAEADSIEAGNECGIGLADFEDFQPDDVIECYVE